MKRFLLGFVVGLFVAGLVLVILIVAALRFGEKKVIVADGSTLVLHLEGEVPEQAPVDLSLPFLQSQQQQLTVFDTWMLLKKAAADTRIRALVFEPRSLRAGWAKLEEIHADILNFKKSGKPVYAFLRGPGAREYYLASAADRVFMTPEDLLDLKGLKVELMYVKGTLDKLGVQMEFEHVGKYKDAPDMFTKTGSSPETREVMNQILDRYYGDLVRTIADSRKKQPDEIKTMLDDGPFLGKKALDGGLVDALAFEDEVFSELREKLKTPAIVKVSDTDYATIAPGTLGLEGPSKIALVTADGEITRGVPRETSSEGITASSLVPLLRKVEEDSSIRGVILRIDSPGGDGIASDDILHAAKNLSRKKPLVFSMSDTAASGGYFIAMTGDPVLAYPNTLTGSIGVFFGRLNLRGLYDKIGVKKELMTRGRYAGIDTDYGPLSDAERNKLRSEIEVFYRGFVERVAAGRKRAYDEIEPLAQGRVWVGEQAKGNGLVDELGGLDRAIELVRERAKIPASEKITIVTYPPKRTLWDVVFGRNDESALAEAQITARLRTFLGKLPIRSLSQGGIMGLMPYAIEVR